MLVMIPLMKRYKKDIKVCGRLAISAMVKTARSSLIGRFQTVIKVKGLIFPIPIFHIDSMSLRSTIWRSVMAYPSKPRIADTAERDLLSISL